MPGLSIEEHKQWYENERSTYESFSKQIKSILEELIKNAKIDYLSITNRAKEVDSFVEKIGRKNYQNPAKDVTDLAGIRVITFIESDALKVNELIKSSFNVDMSKSLDKSDELGIDKFGYRSFHFICDLGASRRGLLEYQRYENLVCEIQVRTALQHAWAEIEHDRNYKFAGVLPPSIKRRLNLVAGLLEIADGEFNNLSIELDKYSKEISVKTKSGDLDIELNSITLEEYFKDSAVTELIHRAAIKAGFDIVPDNYIAFLIDICKHLNIFTVGEIDDILKTLSKSWLEKYLTNVRKNNKAATWSGGISFFVALIIIAKNIKKFKKQFFIEIGWSSYIIDSVLDAANDLK